MEHASTAPPSARPGSAPATNFVSRAASALTRPGALALLWIVVLVHLLRFAFTLPPTFNDFNHFYVASLSFRQGANAYLAKYDDFARSLGLDIGSINLSNHPPTFVLCFEPLTLLGPRAAYWIWFGVSLISFVSAFALLLVTETSLVPRQALLLSGLTLLYGPLFDDFRLANTQTVILLLIVVAMRCARRRRYFATGFSFATAAALKAYPLILALYLICRRKWNALLWMSAAGALIGGLTIWGLGWTNVVSFFGTWRFTNSQALLGQIDNISLNAVISRLFWSHAGAPLTPAIDLLRKATVAAVEIALLVLSVAATAGSGPMRRWRALSLWLVAAILLSPSSRFHYLVLLIIPFVLIVEAACHEESRPRVIYAAIASYLLTFSTYPLNLLHFHLHDWSRLLGIADEYRFCSLAFAYLAVYWFARDQPTITSDSVYA